MVNGSFLSSSCDKILKHTYFAPPPLPVILYFTSPVNPKVNQLNTLLHETNLFAGQEQRRRCRNGCVDMEWAGGGDGMNWEPGPDVCTTAMCKTDNQWEAVTAPEAQLHALR